MEPEPPEFSGSEPDSPPPPPAQPTTLCRRCGNTTPMEAGRCHHCSAILPDVQRAPRVLWAHEAPDRVQRGVAQLFLVFGLMLAANVALSWYFRSVGDEGHNRTAVFHSAFALSMAEGFDTLMVLILWSASRGEIQPSRGMGNWPRLSWALGLPLLAGLLAANFAYHSFLLRISGVRPEADLLLASGHYHWWLLGLICVQPAIVEELFFRRLTFDFFCGATSPGTAAFASAMMFAAAHTGGFISIPYLALFGFGMAWLRWFSGSLVLPMILHGLHNFLVSINAFGFF